MNKDIKDPQLRGVDIDAADDSNDDAELVKEETETLNNNPRNDAEDDE